jgi:hypothetical protein
MELFELSEEWTMILSLIFLADAFPIITGKGWHFHFAMFCFIILDRMGKPDVALSKCLGS